MLGNLTRLLPVRVTVLEARLKGVAGYTGSGVVRRTLWAAGHQTLETDLKGVAGQRADIHTGGVFRASIKVKDGKASAQFDSRRDPIDFSLREGDAIEIRQNGHVILRGTLRA